MSTAESRAKDAERKRRERAAMTPEEYRAWRDRVNAKRRARHAEFGRPAYLDKDKAQRKQKRRAVQKGAEQGWMPSTEVLADYYGNECLQCKSSDLLTLDHIVPLSKGGAHALWNAQIMCRPCNTKKSNTKEEDLRPYPRWQDRFIT